MGLQVGSKKKERKANGGRMMGWMGVEDTDMCLSRTQRKDSH